MGHNHRSQKSDMTERLAHTEPAREPESRKSAGSLDFILETQDDTLRYLREEGT